MVVRGQGEGLGGRKGLGDEAGEASSWWEVWGGQRPRQPGRSSKVHADSGHQVNRSRLPP